MPDAILDPPEPPTQDISRHDLIEGRQRGQHLLDLAVDLAFETDADGRFVFLIPEAPLGWPRGSLIGQPSGLLVGDTVGGDSLNPFRPTEQLTRRRTWLRCHDGGLAMLTISVTPLRDDTGAIIGARGIGIDMTAGDAQTASRLRHAEVLRHILSCVGHEVDADAMVDAALWALIRALDAEGAAIIGSPSEDLPIDVLHECGPGASVILADAARLITQATYDASQSAPSRNAPSQHATVAGRSLLAVGCRTRFGAQAGLAVWRSGWRRPWDAEDAMLVESAATVVRMILDHEAAARQMVHNASTDPLTGLLNRRAFLDEVERHIARLDRENLAGTLMFVDLDAFKAVNERLGHAAGDKVLVLLATLLRKLVRPGDIVARLGGDEFAVWMPGADHLTAAERADAFCKSAPADLQVALPEPFPDLGVSIGIVTRRAGSQESVEALTRRADMAMFQVKRSGRRHWRVSLLDGD